jgi:hypothetical protein
MLRRGFDALTDRANADSWVAASPPTRSCALSPASGHPSGPQAEQPARRTGAVAVAPKPGPPDLGPKCRQSSVE